MTAEQFVAELDAQNQSLLSRLAPDDTLRPEVEGDLNVPNLLRVALRNELEATEIAARWLVTTDAVDVKLALARQVGDEAKHYRMIAERLRAPCASRRRPGRRRPRRGRRDGRSSSRRSSGARRSRRRGSITPLAADPLGEFGDLLRRPDGQIDLGRAALAIARIEYPDLQAEPWLARLDDLAERSGAGALKGRRAFDRLRAFLFEEEGFRGNGEEYYDPRNTFLNDVLTRRLGIPITLSVVTMEVGRRVGLAIEGVGLPAHFVVTAPVDGGDVVVDPFGGGREINRREAEAIVARAVGRPVKLTEAHFAKATRTEIVTRMLNNLKGIYAHRRQWEKALAVIDRLLVIEEGDADLLRERASALVRLRRKTAPLN